jgi:hypothetical protein
MALQYSPKIVTDGLVMCLDPSQNKSYPTTDLPVKGGLVMWMDAADDTTFSYSSGTTVSQWRDKSGYNYHMVPKVNGPTRSVFLNSRKVLAFTAVQTIGNDVIDLSSTTSTVFVVSRYTSGTNQRVLTCNLDSGGGNWLLGHWGGYVNQYYAEGWVSYQVYGNDTVWRVYMGDYSGPPAGANTDLANIYSNGTAIVTNSTAASGGLRKLGINYYSNETSTCEVAEIIVFNRVLTTPERRLVHTYLGQKWGILNTDRSIVDLSGFNDNGLLGDGTTANMPVYDYYNKGAFRFDGSNDFIKVGPNSSLQVNNVTIAAFFKTVNNGQSVQFIAGYGDTGIAGYWIGTSGGPIRFSIGGGSGNYLQQSSGVTPNNDQIYYVVGTYDGTNQRVYVNGVLQASATTVTGNISYTGLTDGFLVGQVQGFTAGRYLTGSVYNVSVYSRALSQAEISQNYEALKSKFANTIVQQGLVLNLDAGNPYSYAGAGTTWIDVSGNTNNATLINSPTYSSDNSGVLNWASASSQYATVAMNSGLRVANITQEVWVFLNSTADQVFIGSQYGTSSNNSFALWVSGGTFYFGVNTGGSFYNSASSAPSTSTWYHLVHTYNGTTQYLYINGVLVTTYNSAASGNITYDTSNTLLAIGADFNGTGYNTGPTLFVNGKMPIVKIYNIALSAAQVLQNYNATKGRFGL